MDHPSQLNDEKKSYCKCSHCGGQFVVPEQALGHKLLCPHCREEITDPDIIEAKAPAMEEDSSLPAPRRGKFTATEQFKTRRSSPEAGEHLRFDDKIQKFEERPPVEETERQRIKSRTTEKEGGELTTFFLILISIVFLSIAGVFYHNTVNLPDLEDQLVTTESLLVDNESKNSRVDDYVIEEDDTFQQKQGDDSPKDADSGFLQRNTVSEDDLKSILTTLRNYHQAGTAEEKLKYVFAAGETELPLKELCSKRPEKALESVKPAQIIDARITNDILIAHVAFDDSSMRSVNFVKDKESGKWLLDWFSYRGYRNTDYGDLIKTRPEKPVEIQVMMGMGANYSPPFESEVKETNYQGKTYINVELTFENGETLQGYVDRNSEMAVRLMNDLMSGSIPATILISFPPAADNAKPDQVVIEQLLRTSWLGRTAQDVYDRATEKAGLPN